jgi:hypothetical protein
LTLSSREAAGDDSIGVQLLADCRQAFNGHDRLATKDLIAILTEDEEAPWATWHKGANISPRSLGRLLHRFGILSRSLRFPGEASTAKGYERDRFEDAWNRYLPHPPDLSGTTAQPASVNGLSPFSIRHMTPLVPDSETPSNPHEYSDVPDVTDKTPDQGDSAELEWLGTASLDDLVAHFERTE